MGFSSGSTPDLVGPLLHIMSLSAVLPMKKNSKEDLTFQYCVAGHEDECAM